MEDMGDNLILIERGTGAREKLWRKENAEKVSQRYRVPPELLPSTLDSELRD